MTLNKKDETIVEVELTVMEFLFTIIEAHIRVMKKGVQPCPFMPDTKVFEEMMKAISSELIPIAKKNDITTVLEIIMKLTKLIDIHDDLRESIKEQYDSPSQ